MRYLTVLLLVLSTNSQLLSQRYEVVPRDLGDGYMIAEGGTITVLDGMVAEWSIEVTGDLPFVFDQESSTVVADGEGATISPELLTVELPVTGHRSLAFVADEISIVPFGPCDPEPCLHWRLAWQQARELPGLGVNVAVVSYEVTAAALAQLQQKISNRRFSRFFLGRLFVVWVCFLL